MSQWYDLIKDDAVFKQKVATFAQYTKNHNKPPNILAHPLLRDMVYKLQSMRMNYNTGLDKAIDDLVSNVADVLFIDLLENNPEFMMEILLHFSHVKHDKELYEIEKNLRQSVGSSGDTRHIVKIVGDNCEYDYWREYSTTVDAIVVRSDYEDTPKEGLKIFEYEFDDENDIIRAEREADNFIQDLYQNKILLSSLITTRASTSSATINSGYNFNYTYMNVNGF